ncbi:penicillin-binding transpeptidase domain-containing protein [Photobacterium minamisatsumaniensis]|uniref:penicillin-binding transpeptidase domain-containing protein n=1 Tax=Photobacterium minamisatsumaniensis TaxID=2910233 RepID=UPI003D0F6066
MNLFKRSAKQNQRRQKAPPAFIPWRFGIICACIMLALAALIGRSAYIQVLEPGKLIQEGDLRSLRVKAMPSARGIISDRNDEQLAVSVPVQAVWADPVQIYKNGGITQTERWHALADVLGLDRKRLLERLEQNKKRRFIYLQRQVSPAMAAYVGRLKLPGVGLKDESRRFYPSGEVSAHLIGVTGIDSHGLEGVERTYDGWLTGEPGRRTVRKDRYGRVVENISLQKREPGKPLNLSIDQRLQAVAYRAVKQAITDYQATSATIIMADVQTGEILAMVNAPSYNPNNRAQLQNYRMRNRSITDAMEPGSTIKPFIVLAAMENGVADEDTIIDTGNGLMQVGGSRVRDVSRVGKANLSKILQKSSNIGVSKLSLAMPIDAVLGMYSSVGLGDASGINLIGEAQGFFPDRRRWSDFERATLSFGYGISVTPIQLVRAYATLGAMGVNRPLSILKTEDVVPGRQVVSTENTRKLLNMLETVTHKGGSAVRAAVPGYRVGAKTGTAVKAAAGGYSDEYIAMTAGLAPISDPRLAMVVVVNEPQGDKYYGGLIAAPIFSEVMKSALQILNIPPDAGTREELNIVNRRDKANAGT